MPTFVEQYTLLGTEPEPQQMGERITAERMLARRLLRHLQEHGPCTVRYAERQEPGPFPGSYTLVLSVEVEPAGELEALKPGKPAPLSITNEDRSPLTLADAIRHVTEETIRLLGDAAQRAEFSWGLDYLQVLQRKDSSRLLVQYVFSPPAEPAEADAPVIREG